MDLYGHNPFGPRRPDLSKGPLYPGTADFCDLDDRHTPRRPPPRSHAAAPPHQPLDRRVRAADPAGGVQLLGLRGDAGVMAEERPAHHPPPPPDRDDELVDAPRPSRRRCTERYPISFGLMHAGRTPQAGVRVVPAGLISSRRRRRREQEPDRPRPRPRRARRARRRAARTRSSRPGAQVAPPLRQPRAAARRRAPGRDFVFDLFDRLCSERRPALPSTGPDARPEGCCGPRLPRHRGALLAFRVGVAARPFKGQVILDAARRIRVDVDLVVLRRVRAPDRPAGGEGQRENGRAEPLHPGQYGGRPHRRASSRSSRRPRSRGLSATARP